MPRADQYPARPLLEVIALGPDDAEAAQAGGADRLEVVSDMASDGLSPTLETLRQIRSVCDLDLRVMVRTDPDFSCRDQASLIGLAGDLAEAGADGLVLGFLRDGALDIEAMRAVTTAVPLPWTCHRAVDHADDYGASIRAAARLSGLDQILTAGASTGLSDGVAHLVAHAGLAPLMAGGGLTASHVPALRGAGVTAFHIGSAARPDWQSPVDSARVAVWRTLLDGLSTGRVVHRRFDQQSGSRSSTGGWLSTTHRLSTGHRIRTGGGVTIPDRIKNRGGGRWPKGNRSLSKYSSRLHRPMDR